MAKLNKRNIKTKYEGDWAPIQQGVATQAVPPTELNLLLLLLLLSSSLSDLILTVYRR